MQHQHDQHDRNDCAHVKGQQTETRLWGYEGKQIHHDCHGYSGFVWVWVSLAGTWDVLGEMMMKSVRKLREIWSWIPLVIARRRRVLKDADSMGIETQVLRFS